MAYTSITLSDPATGYTSVIMPRDGVTALSLDIAPAVREVAEERAAGSGTYDLTQWLSASALTLSLRLWQGNSGQTPEQFMDELSVLLAPWKRPVLTVANDQWQQVRQLTVRFDSVTHPVDNPMTLDMAVSWKVPNAVWEAASTVVAAVPAYIAGTGGVAVTSTGLAVTSAGLAVTPGTFTGQPVVITAGTMPVAWTAKLYGPATGPKFANDTTGLTLEFTDQLVLASGAYVQMDSAARTAYLNGDTSNPVLSMLNWPTSNWWQMQAGTNTLRYYPTSAASGSIAELTFRPAWLP